MNGVLLHIVWNDGITCADRIISNKQDKMLPLFFDFITWEVFWLEFLL